MGLLRKEPELRKRKPLFSRCLSPDVNDSKFGCGISSTPSSAPGSPRNVIQSAKRVTFSDIPTIYTYSLDYESHSCSRSSSSSRVTLDNSNVVSGSTDAPAHNSSKRYQLLAATSISCPELQAQPDISTSTILETGPGSDICCRTSTTSKITTSPASCSSCCSCGCCCSAPQVPTQAAAGQLPHVASAPETTLTDEQLAILSTLAISRQAVLQFNPDDLFASTSAVHQLGQGAHSTVAQATVPWPTASETVVAQLSAAAEAAGVSSTAASILAAAVAGGLPVVIKQIAFERYTGEGLFNIEGRKREEDNCRAVGCSPFFPRLYRAVHYKRRSYFVYSSATADPITLIQYMRRMQQPAAAAQDGAAALAVDSKQEQRQHQQSQQVQNSFSSTDSSSSDSSNCSIAFSPSDKKHTVTSPTNSSWQESVLRILADVGHGLDHLHQLGLLHLDIKPGNIVVREGGHAYLIDLGVACDVGTSLQQHGRCGTEAFMDPEIRYDIELQGSYKIHHDYYSLGAVALYMLTKGDHKVYMTIQALLDQALLRAGSGNDHKVSRFHITTTTNKSSWGCISNTGVMLAESKNATETDGCIAAARRLLAAPTGASHGIVELVARLMGPPNERPRNYEQLQVLLEYAKANGQPEQAIVMNNVQDRRGGVGDNKAWVVNLGFLLLVLGLLMYCFL